MVNLAQAWAEAYQGEKPDVSCQVRGGGSGVGIAALIGGKVDIAPASRAMSEEEMKLAEEKTGKRPKEIIVGSDALAIYVHRDSPLDAISLEDLAQVYGEGGKIEKWQQLGVENPDCPSGEIIRVSRQNNSGTYVYFRDAVLGKTGQYKQGTTALSGSSDVIDLVGNTPCAMGYSGMGYFDPSKVKMLKIAKKKGGAAVPPTLTTALDGSYPIARPLYLYTLGEPTGEVAEFINWVLSPAGQKIVKDVGYVPREIAPENETKAKSEPAAETPSPQKPEDPQKPEEKAAAEHQPQS
jgi:phosphate transport system substrate-binding protein